MRGWCELQRGVEHGSVPGHDMIALGHARVQKLEWRGYSKVMEDDGMGHWFVALVRSTSSDG